MKIGLFGGSFNPINKGHVKVISGLLDKKIVDRIWIIPCKKHAFNKSLANEKDRLKMIKLATKNFDKVEICKIELESKGKNYTIDTVRKLKKKYKHKFFFIIGSDILYEIKRWHKYKHLLKEIDFIVFKRKGYKIKKVEGFKPCYLFRDKIEKFSSTEIRKRIKESKSFKHLLPNLVYNYIKNHRLYK